MFHTVLNVLIVGLMAAVLWELGRAAPPLERWFTQRSPREQRTLVIGCGRGSFELTAIAVSGAAGLVIGHALAHPGAYTRAEALRRRGLVAVQLALGAGAMLVVAAAIAAFWSPLSLPAAVKYAAGAALWLLVFAYLALSGRERERTPEPA